MAKTIDDIFVLMLNRHTFGDGADDITLGLLGVFDFFENLLFIPRHLG